jgi:hypothetical protein
MSHPAAPASAYYEATSLKTAAAFQDIAQTVFTILAKAACIQNGEPTCCHWHTAGCAVTCPAQPGEKTGWHCYCECHPHGHDGRVIEPSLSSNTRDACLSKAKHTNVHGLTAPRFCCHTASSSLPGLPDLPGPCTIAMPQCRWMPNPPQQIATCCVLHLKTFLQACMPCNIRNAQSKPDIKLAPMCTYIACTQQAMCLFIKRKTQGSYC